MVRATVIAGAVAAAVGGLWLAGKLLNKGKDAAYLEGVDLSQDEVVAIFKKLRDDITKKMGGIMKNMHLLKQQIPDEAQLQMIICTEFEKQLAASQEVIFLEFNADEEDVERATNYFLAKGDEEVKACVEALKEVYANFGGQVDTDIPEDLTLDKMCEIIGDYLELMGQKQAEVQQTVMRMQMAGQQPGPEIEQTLKTLVEHAQAQFFAKYSINQMIFASACKKYQTDPKFVAAAQEAQKRSANRAAGMMGGPPPAPPAASAVPEIDDDGQID